MPGTVPLLEYCQDDQPAQPAGVAGVDAALAAIHSGSEPKAVLLPVQVLHQPAVV